MVSKEVYEAWETALIESVKTDSARNDYLFTKKKVSIGFKHKSYDKIPRECTSTTLTLNPPAKPTGSGVDYGYKKGKNEFRFPICDGGGLSNCRFSTNDEQYERAFPPFADSLYDERYSIDLKALPGTETADMVIKEWTKACDFYGAKFPGIGTEPMCSLLQSAWNQLQRVTWASGDITVFFVAICEGVYLYPMAVVKALTGVYYEKKFGNPTTYEAVSDGTELYAAIKTVESAETVETLPKYPFSPMVVKEFANSNINDRNLQEYYPQDLPAKRRRTGLGAAFLDFAA